jgi:hypothetical protein
MSDGLAVERIASATYNGNDGFSLLHGEIVSESVAKTMKLECERPYRRTILQRLPWDS